jgi:glutaredoxin
VKEFLSHAGVKFFERNVEESYEAYDELLARGFRSVPVVFIGERVVKGFDAQHLLQALRAAGVPTPGL